MELLQVSYVTPNYIGVPGKYETLLVHRSQVTGSPKVGDWVEVSGKGMDTCLKVISNLPEAIAEAG